MDVSRSLLAELQKSANTGSGDRLAEITKGVTRLFLARSQDYSDEQIEIFDDVLAYLIDKIETRALVELGEQLARQRRAPPRVIQRLARHDDIAVAGPVLARSKRLADSDLISIIETKPQAHLYAISQRKRVPAPVTDALVTHGKASVLRSVTDNPGARFSIAGFKGLAAHASGDDVLAEKLARRPDVPSDVYCQLVVQATETVRRRLITAARPELHAEIETALKKVAGRLLQETVLQGAYAAAGQRLLLRCSDYRIFEDDVIDILRIGDRDQLIVALTLMCEIPVELAEKAIADESNDLLLVLCKVLDFAWTTVLGILGHKLGAQATPSVVSAAHHDFSKMSRMTSRQMLRLWQRGDIC